MERGEERKEVINRYTVKRTHNSKEEDREKLKKGRKREEGERMKGNLK